MRRDLKLKGCCIWKGLGRFEWGAEIEMCFEDCGNLWVEMACWMVFWYQVRGEGGYCRQHPSGEKEMKTSLTNFGKI